MPKALFYQTPAPVLRTVLAPERKSGIPQEVDIPAPVKAIKCLLFKIRLAINFTFSSSTYLESKCSFFYYSVLRIVSAMCLFNSMQFVSINVYY